MAHNNLIRASADMWQGPNVSWSPATVYALNSFVVPTAAHANGLVFKTTSVSGTGTSGSTEPIWPGALTDTVTDNPGGNEIIWTAYTTTAILASELEELDANLQAAINGVDGSIHAPQQICTSSGVTIAGSGLQVTGPLVIARGGQFHVTAAAGIALNDGDVPQYSPTHVGRTRVFCVSCQEGREVVGGTWRRRMDGGMQSVAPMVDISDGNGAQPATLIVPIRAHEASTLSQVQVFFRIGWPHSSLPQTMPKARVVRVSAAGQVQPISISAASDPSGYVAVPVPSSAMAWTGQQSITVTCVDPTVNVVDIANYTYYVEIVEEQWAASSLPGYPFSLVFTQPVAFAGSYDFPFTNSCPNAVANINSSWGVTIAAGQRVLLTGETYVNFDGIWTASLAPWQRAPDFADFEPGMVVPVTVLGTNDVFYWQVTSTLASWSAGTQPNGTTVWKSGTGTPANENNAVIPTVPNGYWYFATAFGSSPVTGSTEPVWPTTVGQTVLDNTGSNQITWTCMGAATQAITFVPRAAADDETSLTTGSAFFAHGNIFSLARATFTDITQQTFE